MAGAKDDFNEHSLEFEVAAHAAEKRLIRVPSTWGTTTVPAWLVVFDCGHTRHPEACHCSGDDDGHAPHEKNKLRDSPPPIGWAGWCVECNKFRTTVDVVI